MNRKQTLTDYEIIQQQFLSFRALEIDIDNINIINKYHAGKDEIGESTDHIKYDSYREIFDKLMRDEEYTILLTDDAIICMQYIFDDDGNMMQHTLSYLPNYRQDLLGKEDEFQDDANIDEKKLSKRLSNYIRVDYGELGHEEYYHALSHLHIGLFKETLRIPLQCALYPNEFLYLIFKYLYHLSDDKLKKLECDIPKKCLLNENEMKKLRMLFGNCLN